MTTRLMLSLIAGCAAIIWTELAGADTLHVTVSNVPATEGRIMLQIMQGETEFKGEAPAIMSIVQRAQSGTMHFTATLPSGEYAIRVMHDRNDNGELDSNFVGMPSEPWAFSNNAVGQFGPPQWSDVKFALADEVTQTLELNF